ncbi:MAG TPA: Na+/H+ antiporter NhaA [Terriglobales bacterium]|nr:Na+/H+ antiporter NhaA [Terriglobales bacterium]
MAGIPPRSRGKAVVRTSGSYSARRFLLPVQKFVHTEVSGGIVLLAAAVAALVWANSPWADSYEALWSTVASLRIGSFLLAHSLREWVNDALMVLFFFVVGLELKRELLRGELSDWQRASLPVAAALGGMIVPASLYIIFNYSQPTEHGWGIPMATDIAFALGVLAMLGHRIPSSLRVFLLALATVDDVGAILVIAVFYSGRLMAVALVFGLVLITMIVVMQRLGVRNLLYYVPVAALFWLAVLASGVHATIAGVILGFLTPIRPYVTKEAFSQSGVRLTSEVQQAVAVGDGNQAEGLLGQIEELTAATEAPADRLIRLLHPWSSFLVLPIFALANAGVVLTTETLQHALAGPVSVSRGILVGLVIGKPLGIASFAFFAVRLRLARLVGNVRWAHLFGVGFLGGIGFTVSLFISDLAFADPAVADRAKMGVLIGSLVAGIAGYLILRVVSARVARSRIARQGI